MNGQEWPDHRHRLVAECSGVEKAWIEINGVAVEDALELRHAHAEDTEGHTHGCVILGFEAGGTKIATDALASVGWRLR